MVQQHVRLCQVLHQGMLLDVTFRRMCNRVIAECVISTSLHQVEWCRKWLYVTVCLCVCLCVVQEQVHGKADGSRQLSIRRHSTSQLYISYPLAIADLPSTPRRHSEADSNMSDY